MKICIPVQENKGLDSIVYDHFGSAPHFLIYNVENEEIKIITNNDAHHEHGMCQPLKALGGETVDAILVGGIGAGALTKLNNQGVKAYRVVDGTAQANIKLMQANQLPEFTVSHSCNHSGCGGH